MKKVIVTLITILSVFYVNAQYTNETTEVVEPSEQIHIEWQENFEQAIEKAASENKPILIYFTGSDWCGPCKRLDKELFHTEKFANFSNENLVLYTADSPRNRDLVSKENTKMNKKLSRKYNQTSFPTMIMVNASGSVLGRKNGSYMTDYYYPFFEDIVNTFY